MIRTISEKQLPLSGFETPFEVSLDANNRWVQLAQVIPWDELADGYYSGFHQTHERPAKDARVVIGAVIIKHKLCLEDEETILQIQENMYMQYIIGLKVFKARRSLSRHYLSRSEEEWGTPYLRRLNKASITHWKPKSKEPNQKMRIQTMIRI